MSDYTVYLSKSQLEVIRDACRAYLRTPVMFVNLALSDEELAEIKDALSAPDSTVVVQDPDVVEEIPGDHSRALAKDVASVIDQRLAVDGGEEATEVELASGEPAPVIVKRGARI